MLMTREYRAKLAAGGSTRQKAPTHAVIRVRLPDGLVLQGEFNAGEQVTRHMLVGLEVSPTSRRSCMWTHTVLWGRLPIALLLQVSQMFEWVSDSLRDPARTHELITMAPRHL